MCVFLGLKKPRDFTVFEGHKYPLVKDNEDNKTTLLGCKDLNTIK